MNLYRDLSKRISLGLLGRSIEELAAKQLHEVAPHLGRRPCDAGFPLGAWSLRRVRDRPQKGGYSCSGRSRYRVWNAGLQDQPQFPPS